MTPAPLSLRLPHRRALAVGNPYGIDASTQSPTPESLLAAYHLEAAADAHRRRVVDPVAIPRLNEMTFLTRSRTGIPAASYYDSVLENGVIHHVRLLLSVLWNQAAKKTSMPGQRGRIFKSLRENDTPPYRDALIMDGEEAGILFL